MVANHDLNSPLSDAYLSAIYAEFQSLYAAGQGMTPPVASPLEFQTSGQQVAWSTLIPSTISTYHPTEIEVWNTTATTGGLANVTLSELQQWAAEIKAAN